MNRLFFCASFSLLILFNSCLPGSADVIFVPTGLLVNVFKEPVPTPDCSSDQSLNIEDIATQTASPNTVVFTSNQLQTTNLRMSTVNTTATPTMNTADTVDIDTQNIVDQELLDIDTSSNTFLQWASDHRIWAGTLAALAVAGIVAISVAVPLGVHQYHIYQHDRRTTATNGQTAAIASYLNYLKTQQKTPVLASSSPY